MREDIRYVLPTRSAIKVTVAAIKRLTPILSAAPGLTRSSAFLLISILLLSPSLVSPSLFLSFSRSPEGGPYVRASCDRKRDDIRNRACTHIRISPGMAHKRHRVHITVRPNERWITHAWRGQLLKHTYTHTVPPLRRYIIKAAFGTKPGFLIQSETEGLPTLAFRSVFLVMCTFGKLQCLRRETIFKRDKCWGVIIDFSLKF